PGADPQAYYFFDDISVMSLGHTIGITELGASAGFHNNEIQIHWNGVSQLDKLVLFDASGRLIIQRTGRWNTGSHPIQSRSELASGMYIVHGFSGARHFVARFVK
ncbi:MAG: T9SS type A sorting domain-containing protein, partial [Flavobacteriales bacterium]